MDQTHVALYAPDSLTYAGVVHLLESSPDITVEQADDGPAHVRVVAAERLSSGVITALRRAAAEKAIPVVLVVRELTESELITAVECKVVAVLPRTGITAERLRQGVLAAAKGDGVMAPALIGELVKHIERLQRDVLTPNGLNGAGLTRREIDVLRLMADGLDTNEIADNLCYSERTVKNIIHGLNRRLKVRNRSHAVAYALRSGMI